MATHDLLLVEDSPADLDLIEKAFGKFDNNIEIHKTTGGEAGLEFLQKNEIPDLVILDLDMPKVDGFEFLKEIRKDEELKHLPVVVLTMSNAGEDIIKAYKRGANCCFTKPLGFEDLVDVLEDIETFWLQTAQLPED